jgi:hypothetical protein
LPEADDGADRDGARNRNQNPEQGREKDSQAQGLPNFADPADLASPPRTLLGERIRFDGARLGGNAPDLLNVNIVHNRKQPSTRITTMVMRPDANGRSVMCCSGGGHMYTA